MLSDTSWTGTLGERGQMSGSGSSAILNVGDGRQCASVRRTGAGQLTVRVGDESDTDAGQVVTGLLVQVCGEGFLR